MLRIFITFLFVVGCGILPGKNNNSSLVSEEERAEIFASFDYINKQVWAIDQTSLNLRRYKKALNEIPNGEKKKNVLNYLQEMKVTTCPLKKNFILCGHIEKVYTFCDDAKMKLNKKWFKEFIGKKDVSIELAKELGCY